MSLSLRPEYVLRPANLFRRLILRRLWRNREVVVGLRNGCRILVREGEFIGNNIINTRCHDASLSEFLWRIIRKDDTCIDVGANIGYVSLLMAARCGSGGQCFSFEADPDLFTRMGENFRRNAFSHVTAVNAAVSDKEGALAFERGGELNRGLGRIVAEGASGSLQIPALRLDDHPATEKRIRIVKIDVEGHELQVLKGMPAALAAKKIDHLVLEEHGGAGAESIELLRRAGYTIFRLVRSMRGPKLIAPDTACEGDLEPNFVAALDPAGLQDSINKPGWSVF